MTVSSGSARASMCRLMLKHATCCPALKTGGSSRKWKSQSPVRPSVAVPPRLKYSGMSRPEGGVTRMHGSAGPLFSRTSKVRRVNSIVTASGASTMLKRKVRPPPGRSVTLSAGSSLLSSMAVSDRSWSTYRLRTCAPSMVSDGAPLVRFLHETPATFPQRSV